MRLTVVVDNRARPPLRPQAAFAVWIEERAGRAALFDTGGSGEVLLHNLEVLGLDPRRLRAVAISHAHADHTGGLAALLPFLREGTPLYAHPTLFRQRYSDHGRGPDPVGMRLSRAEVAARLTLRLSREPQEIFPGLWTSGEIVERPFPEGRSTRHFIRTEQGFVPDPYEDDMALVLRWGEGVFLLCGCCHAGLLNTMRHVERRWMLPIRGAGGGTHLINASAAQIAATVEALRRLRTLRLLWTGHCSGAAFEAAVAQALPDRWVPMEAGAELSLEENGLLSSE